MCTQYQVADYYIDSQLNNTKTSIKSHAMNVDVHNEIINAYCCEEKKYT